MKERAVLHCRIVITSRHKSMSSFDDSSAADYKAESLKPTVRGIISFLHDRTHKFTRELQMISKLPSKNYLK